MATETELKLLVRPADLPALRRELKMMAGGGTSRRSDLVSTYYETEDRALARMGLVLRVREQDGQFIQTAKSLSAVGAPLSRDEWEDVIPADLPDPHAPESGRYLANGIAERLEPIFRTVVRRDRIELWPAPGTRIEAAVDRGEIRSCGRQRGQRISEIELELKSGDVTALYDVALKLLAISPLRLGLASKSARGYELAGGAARAPKAVRAAPIQLDASVPAEEALRRVGTACLDQILRNIPAVLDGRPEAVHQMRVAIRRLRTALAAFRKLLPKDERRWASDELRWLANTLGEARNLDVFGSALIAPAKAALAGKPDMRRLEREVERRRRQAYSEIRDVLQSTRCTGLILRLLRWFEGHEWRQSGDRGSLQRPVGNIAPAIFDRRRRAVERRRKGVARQSARRQHKLRLALKKLRYTVDLFAGLYPVDRATQFTGRLKRLQNELGRANDVYVGARLLQRLVRQASKGGDQIAAAGRQVLAWHERSLAKQRKKTRKGLRHLLGDRPFWRE